MTAAPDKLAEQVEARFKDAPDSCLTNVYQRRIAIVRSMDNRVDRSSPTGHIERRPGVN